jgi:multiple sugar transport system substrate-binding protein
VFAVWGSVHEIAAYQRVVDDYNAHSTVVDVRIESWHDAASMLEDVRSGKVTPDLYLLPRDELKETIESGRNRPLVDLLDARGVQFGDDFSRDSVAAFSADDNLQCMPYTTSPMVMYYNTDLIDFDTMEQRELPVPSEDRDRWSLEQFRAAAEFASRPRTGAKGVYIDPTLDGLAPFLLSGGGRLFDDDVDPTSLALGEDGSVDAMRETLEVLRDPRITLSDAQLERKSAFEWFQQGRLGMIAGFRDLTPALRNTPGLRFDVLPMPVLGSSATVGRLNGVCVAEGDQDRVEQAADFLVHLVGDQAVAELAATGYVMPTNLEVAFSPEFLQPGREPEHSTVFNEAVGSIVLPPLIDVWRDLELVVRHDLAELLTEPVVVDLEAELAEIDERSQMVLGP